MLGTPCSFSKNLSQEGGIMVRFSLGLGLLWVLGAALSVFAQVLTNTATVVLPEAGFLAPESALYDPREDVYYVSNINGAGNATDDNGFISRVSPDGRVLALKWIDGASPEVMLNAPKGMALVGDTLYVADITVVRMFDRTTGHPKGNVEVPGAVFLNDVAAGPDGAVYISDTQREAIYRISPEGVVSQIAQGSQLGRPNGVTFAGGKLLIGTFDLSAEIRALDLATGQISVVARLPASQIDGLEALPDGSLLATTWWGSAVVGWPPMAR